MIYHKVIKIKGKLKPVCMPTDPKKWFFAPMVKVNCPDCLSGRRAETKGKIDASHHRLQDHQPSRA